MRIAIIVIGNSRRNNYLNGHNLRYDGGGASGTDTSSMLVAEYLAGKGHEVVMTVDELEPLLEEKLQKQGKKFVPGAKSYGVAYTNKNFDGIENKTFDVLINMLWFQDYDKLPITVTKSLIYWCHMQWVYGIDAHMAYARKHNLTLGMVNVSTWQASVSQNVINHVKANYEKTKQFLISNPIFDEMIREVEQEPIQKKKGKFIFHATWPTGGDVAMQAVRELDMPEKQFHAFDYFITVHGHTEPYFHNHQAVDRKTLYKHLAESEYFIYPLHTIHKVLRKDTFACTVAEALAFNTIVLTYPLGALPTVFGDKCVWLDAPPGADLDELQRADLARDEEGKFKYTKNIVDKINYLEANPEIKEKYRSGGRQYVLENFNLNKIGKMWEDCLEELTK